MNYVESGVGADRKRIELHVTSCNTCEKRVEQWSRVSREIDSVVEDWRPSPELVSRLESARRTTGRTRSRRWSPTPLLASAFAGLVLMLTVGIISFDRTPALELDDLLVNEFNTFVASGRGLDYESALPDEVRAWFEGKIMFNPPLPGSVTGLSLAGARLCNLAGDRVASYMYKVEEGWVSVYIHRSGDSESKRQRRIDGYAVLSWTENGLRFVLVGAVAEGRLRELAESLGQPATSIS